MILKYDMNATTIIIVRHNNQVVIGADSQGTIGSYIASNNVNKLRSFKDNSIYMGFAGVAKDGIALFEYLESRLQMYNYDLLRACSEMARDFRNASLIAREAVVLIADQKTTFRFTGSGELTSVEDICAVGSGSLYALCSAKALIKHAPHLSALEIVESSMVVAGETCTHTNLNIKTAVINPKPKQDKQSVLLKSDLPKEIKEEVKKTVRKTVKKTVKE